LSFVNVSGKEMEIPVPGDDELIVNSKLLG